MPGFKTYARGARNMVVEENFNFGMRYTDTPMAEGYCKALVNYDFKDMGQVLVPRPGYQNLYEAGLGTSSKAYLVHHTAQGTIYNEDTGQDTSMRYILFGYNDGSDDWFDFSDARILVEERFNTDYTDTENKSFMTVLPELDSIEVEEVTYTDQFLIRRTPRVRTQLLHNISLVDAETFQGMPYLPNYTMLNNVAILPVRYTPANGTAIDGFARLRFITDNLNPIKAKLEFIEPQVITPTEAINYGYNMLSTTPYAFSDVISAAVPANYIIMEGLLAYHDEACTQVKFNARVGETLTFRLYAKYPDQTSQYKFRWEIREIGTENVSIYEDHQTTSKVYQFQTDRAKNITPAVDEDFVKLTFQPPYRRFSITVIAFSVNDLTEPLQVMTLASYTLSDGVTQNNSLEVRNYPLYTTSDLCTWRQRIVLWGVDGADNMLFVSDINNPAYFPYPHNVDIFNEKIVVCVPYLNDLLVFTESRLYRLAWSEDGLSFKTDMIQDKLFMSEFDKETITVVQNMVFFKNGNYFYMVVPKTSSAQPGALQLAPVSNPITNLLDRFQEAVKELAFRLYNPTDATYFPYMYPGGDRDIIIYDYHNYLDNSVVRNIYKFRLVDRDHTTGTVQRTLLYFDFVLNYDTMSRAWTSYIVQSNATRMWPYRQNVTDTTVYINVVNDSVEVTEEEDGVVVDTYQGYDTRCVFIKPNVLSPVDNFPIAQEELVRSRIMRNHQYLDTGYRDHETQLKKRYREIQFKVNNISQESLQFGTEFMIDDQLRKSLFRYETRHVEAPDSSEYGYFYVERVFDNPSVVAGATILDKENPEAPYVEGEHVVPSDTIVLQSNRWTLDVSQLSNVSVLKVRMKVSGKGYSPRLILVSFNDRLYEFLNHNWVFRAMNAR